MHNFTLTAVNIRIGATIKCNGSVGFKFMYVQNLTISGIIFEKCGADVLHLTKYFVSATLNILISCNVAIKNITITKGIGFGLLVCNSHGQFLLQNSNFIENELNFGLFKLALRSYFTCSTSSQKDFIIIVQSRFVDGNTSQMRILITITPFHQELR